MVSILITVVGIVADAHNNSLREAPVNMVYMPYWSNPPYNDNFLIRSSQDPSSLTGVVRRTIWSYNPNVVIEDLNSLDSQVSESVAPERIETIFLAAFGGAALFLALLGIYGKLSYSVEARTHEIGIRMALGASAGDVRSMVLASTLRFVLMGVAAGIVLAWVAGRVLASQLWGVSGYDPATLCGVIAVPIALGLAAAYVPSVRATRVDPAVCLRWE
jgi:ABC-type antimicrobial peptide transport system permease subunit